MTPRSLFIIILRILGLFFARDFLSQTPQLLSSILYAVAGARDAVSVIVVSCLVVMVYFLICWGLIVKSAALVDKLKLDKGFDEEIITINLHRSTVLTISLIVIGGLILVDSIPELCRHLMIYYEQKEARYGNIDPNISWAVLDAVRVVIGFLLITEKRKIVNFIELKRKA